MNALDARKIADEVNAKPVDEQFLSQVRQKVKALSHTGRYTLTLKEDDYNIYNRAFTKALKDDGFFIEFDGQGSLTINWRNATTFQAGGK